LIEHDVMGQAELESLNQYEAMKMVTYDVEVAKETVIGFVCVAVNYSSEASQPTFAWVAVKSLHIKLAKLPSDLSKKHATEAEYE
jgi:hypothetical protein